MGRKKFREVERSCHADSQRIAEFFVATFVNTLHQRKRVIHQHIHMTVFFDNELHKFFKNIFLGKVPHKAGILADVNIPFLFILCE